VAQITPVLLLPDMNLPEKDLPILIPRLPRAPRTW
jgi:hypothetical protein